LESVQFLRLLFGIVWDSCFGVLSPWFYKRVFCWKVSDNAFNSVEGCCFFCPAIRLYYQGTAIAMSLVLEGQTVVDTPRVFLVGITLLQRRPPAVFEGVLCFKAKY